jgi:hypothetical protein
VNLENTRMLNKTHKFENITILTGLVNMEYIYSKSEKFTDIHDIKFKK